MGRADQRQNHLPFAQPPSLGYGGLTRPCLAFSSQDVKQKEADHSLFLVSPQAREVLEG